MLRPRTSNSWLVAAVAAALLVAPVPTLAARQKAAKIECTVRNQAGEPVAGAHVVATSPSAPDVRIEATTDVGGKFALTLDRPDLDYVWTLDAEGYERLVTVLEIDPRYPRSYDLVMTSADSPEARKRRAVEVYNRGVDELRKGQAAVALESFRQAVELDPKLQAGHRAIAEAALASGDAATTAEEAEKVLAAEPDSVDGLRLLLESSVSLGDDQRIEGAAKHLAELARDGNAQAAQAASYAAVLVFNDGVAAEHGEDFEKAEARYTAAADLDPKLPPAQAGLAIRRLAAGDAAGALGHADQLLALDPGNAQGLRLRYSAATALGDPALIDEALAALEASAPEAAADETYRKGEAAFKAGDLAQAQELLGKVLEFDPERADAHYTLGLCYLNSGDTAKAREQLGKVLELAPDSSWARDAKEMLGYLK